MRYYKAIFLLFLLVLFGFSDIKNPSNKKNDVIQPPFLGYHSNWIDTLMHSMTVDEKIGQLFMVAGYSNQSYNEPELIQMIEDYHIGGVCFFQGGPYRQAKITNNLQANSKIPLLIAMDAEWGLAMRLDSTIKYPRQMMLGAIQNERVIYKMASDMARQLKRLGVHMNFAPVADVNNNPGNPVINSRSFGENRENVAIKSMVYMLGLQDNKILATAKHFPGHGDTDTDSHHALPVINHSRARIDSVELFPFKHLINSGVSAIMTAHLNVMALDSTPSLPSSLSNEIVSGLLKNKLGFRGLIVTDALNMRGASDHFRTGQLEAKAFKAGNDILLMPGDLEKARNAIKRALKNGDVSMEQLDMRVRKILAAKQWVGLDRYSAIDLNNLHEDLNKPEFILNKRKLVENSLTIVKNDGNILPLKRLDTLHMASLAIGKPGENLFQNTLKLYKSLDSFTLDKNPTDLTLENTIQKLSGYNLVIVSIHGTSNSPSRNFGITTETVQLIHKLARETNVILNVFANPYSLKLFENIRELKGVIVSYQDDRITEELSAQLIFGAFPALGKLPVTASEQFIAGNGHMTSYLNRLKYTIPEEVEINSNGLNKIDSMVHDAMQQEAMPGCQVLFAKDGKVFFNKSYGYHTYKKEIPVKQDDLYDLASLTKILATVPLMMKLQDQGKMSVDDKLEKHLPFLDTCAKGELNLGEILAHQAGLLPWIPFYLTTLESMFAGKAIYDRCLSDQYPYKIDNGFYLIRNISYRDNIFSREFSREYSVNVADNMYMNATYIDTIYHTIYNSELSEKKNYRYSDLGYYLFYRIIENISGRPYPSLLKKYFYNVMGISDMVYLPLLKFNKHRIVPTEDDLYFRRQLLQGHVHDPGAAMLGGVSGHAGLFGCANDVAKMMQLFLNKGYYGDTSLIDHKTVDVFLETPFVENENRRALGFDKPPLKREDSGPCTKLASNSSFGHSGFTGTLAWADPEYNLVYVFLSNRIHPNQYNKKLLELDLRTNIQKVVYELMLDKSDTLQNILTKTRND